MTRPRGNPDLERHQFATDRDEPLEAKITIRITAQMEQQLKELPNYREFVRTAIAEKLDSETN
jgi:hypothetical protein